MIQKLLLALVVALPLAAFAKEESKTLAAEVQWSHKGSYIYRKQAWRVTWDADQQEALKKSAVFVTGQLQSLNKAKGLDPDGDLKAIGASVDALNSQVDTLVNAAGKLYGDAAPYGFSRYDGLPSGLIIFGGLEYDKNLVKFVKGGGSVMLGVIFVPLAVERTNIYTREVVHYTEWDSALVLIPTANAGVGISATNAANSTNKRIGVGVIWGSLNSASELVGVSYGPSTTLSLGAGLNLKALALKNFSKAGAVSNVIVLAGVERGSLAADTHFNVGGIIDASGFLKSLVTTGSDVVEWAHDKIQKKSKGKNEAKNGDNDED